MGRPRHPNKHIEEAIQYAEDQGWRVEAPVNGPNWGFIYCPHAARGGCSWGVYSTPVNPENHAKKLKRNIDRCNHASASEDG